MVAHGSGIFWRGRGGIFRTDCRRLRGIGRILGWASDDDGVASIIGDTTGFREDFQNSDGPVRLVHHGVGYGADHGDGFALSFFNANADLRMGDQAIGFQDFRDLLFGLDFRQPRDMQAHGDQGNTDGARLANAHFAAKFFDIKDVDVDDVTIADDVVVRRQVRSRGKRTNPIVGLLRRFENGLCAGGRRQCQSPKKGTRNETPLQRTQFDWLHASG